MLLDQPFDGNGSDNKSNLFDPAELLQHSWSDGLHKQIFAPPNPSEILPSLPSLDLEGSAKYGLGYFLRTAEGKDFSDQVNEQKCFGNSSRNPSDQSKCGGSLGQSPDVPSDNGESREQGPRPSDNSVLERQQHQTTSVPREIVLTPYTPKPQSEPQRKPQPTNPADFKKEK